MRVPARTESGRGLPQSKSLMSRFRCEGWRRRSCAVRPLYGPGFAGDNFGTSEAPGSRTRAR